MNLLLERGDINPGLPDRNGRTLLLFVAEWGRQDLVKLLLGREDVNPDLPDTNGQTFLSYAATKGREGIVRLLSDFTALDCESSEYRDRMPTSVADENASCKEATHPPPATEPTCITSYIADRPAPEAPISGPLLCEPPTEKASPLKQFSPDQFLSTPVPSAPLPSLGSGSVFYFFLRTLVPLIFLFFALMMCHGYGDSLELFHANYSAWR